MAIFCTLSGSLVDVQNGDKNRHKLLLWNGQGNTDERIKSVALFFTGWTGQRTSELSLEHIHHHTVFKSHVIGQGFSGQNFVTWRRHICSSRLGRGCSGYSEPPSDVKIFVYPVKKP